MAFIAIIAVALVLAPGLQTRDLPSIANLPVFGSEPVMTLPAIIDDEPVQRPSPLPTPELRPQPIEPEVTVPELRPEPIAPEATVPELRPEPIAPEATVPELRPEPIAPEVPTVPELITVNPCEACFSYMNELIEQLTDVAVETPTVPELMPIFPEIEAHPMPEVETIPGVSVPLPLPVLPEQVAPHPIPEVETSPEVGVLPQPLPVVPETRPAVTNF